MVIHDNTTPKPIVNVRSRSELEWYGGKFGYPTHPNIHHSIWTAGRKCGWARYAGEEGEAWIAWVTEESRKVGIEVTGIRV
ncbi:hypothetical protein AVEN_211040-1 [Araneus ventricosus]|uniref:Uncharacterized protein n=1 Tax=Araneus ventricosus TaxID=182803 RepID=A0A4Y2RHU2_ARAVE|nr:hypothetical protein AVEN_158682-1 [Araneus ventricosus]GBN85691.1 hypothetical protein AVEN_211040-1 [Araneus ventricosus]